VLAVKLVVVLLIEKVVVLEENVDGNVVVGKEGVFVGGVKVGAIVKLSLGSTLI
jgi:hypothetical protein